MRKLKLKSNKVDLITERKLIETISSGDQVLNIADKHFKAAIMHLFKELNVTMLRESMYDNRENINNKI